MENDLAGQSPEALILLGRIATLSTVTARIVATAERYDCLQAGDTAALAGLAVDDLKDSLTWAWGQLQAAKLEWQALQSAEIGDSIGTA